MRVINVSLNELETKVLLIGFEGENQITQVRIDAAEILTDHPNATPTLIAKPLFGFAYPVIVTKEGTDVVWEIDNSVLSFHGDGEIQLTFTEGTVIAKSYVGRIRIKRSLAVNGEAPDPIETWEQAATAKLAEVDAQIGELEDMVEAAEAAKDEAQDIVDDAAADIQAAGAAQVQVVQAKGTEVLNSIPADYTELSGDVSGLKSAINQLFTGSMKQAILDLFAKCAYVDDSGQDYIDALSGLFFPGVASISAVFTQPSTDIFPSDDLSSLKNHLVVTATMTDESTQIISANGYTLSGSLTGGKSTITVGYAGKTTTFDCYVVFELESEFVSTGENSLPTGWTFNSSDAVTICIDFTLDAVPSGIVELVSSYAVSGTADYFGLSFKKYDAETAMVWGIGTAYVDRVRNINVGDRVRIVATTKKSELYAEGTIANITDGTSQHKKNTSQSVSYFTDNEIIIGKYAINGLECTVHDCKVFGRELSAAEISSYLAGE